VTPNRRQRWETVTELAGEREALEPILAAAGSRGVRRSAQMRKPLQAVLADRQ